MLSRGILLWAVDVMYDMCLEYDQKIGQVNLYFIKFGPQTKIF